MGLLEKSIVQQLLELSPHEKRESVEPKILKLLGGTPNKTVTKLPPRRGKGDGGLDGRVPVRVPSSPPDSRSDSGELVAAEAAINIKVEKAKFSRKAFGGFINDMDREGLRFGIIVTAAGLSPDAQSEMRRHNARGQIVLAHYSLEELISGHPAEKGIAFAHGALGDTIKKNLTEYLASQ